MNSPLWSKDDTRIDESIQKFLAGDDVLLDRELIEFDIIASRAHADGLAAIGILTAAEARHIARELDALSLALRDGRFVLDARFEDSHSAIEHWLTQRLGEAGRKIHTGRSRNDQVLVAMRLWIKSRLASLLEIALAIAATALDRAESEAEVPMPGYTHLQRAVVSSAGLWWAGWVEAFLDDATLAADALRWIDSSPLGSAAGFGVNLPLARDAVSDALGFDRLQINPAYAQLSRGKFELHALAVLGQSLLDLRRLAWDLSLFTSSEFGFVELPARYATGSSIMPNKRNPDLIELLRASYAVCAGARTEIESLMSLPSGYQRDLQFTKAPALRAFGHGLAALDLVPGLLGSMAWNTGRMRAAIEPAMHATDLATERARDGVPFRDAYRDAAREASDDKSELAARTPEQSIAARVSPGACANLRLDDLRARLVLMQLAGAKR